MLLVFTAALAPAAAAGGGVGVGDSRSLSTILYNRGLIACNWSQSVFEFW